MADKGKALDLVLAQIERQFGKGTVMRMGDRANEPIEVIPTGSTALDVALGVGGLPRGRVVEVYGPESSGKTTLTLHAVANAQKAGGQVAFVDAEHALDPEYAKKLGVDIDNLSWLLRRTAPMSQRRGNRTARRTPKGSDPGPDRSRTALASGPWGPEREGTAGRSAPRGPVGGARPRVGSARAPDQQPDPLLSGRPGHVVRPLPFRKRPSTAHAFFSPISVSAQISSAHVMDFPVRGDMCHAGLVPNGGLGVLRHDVTVGISQFLTPPEVYEVRNRFVGKGARRRDFCDVSVEMRRDALIVVTDVSGYGKSSRAFGAGAGLPPVIAIDQKTLSRNPRSPEGSDRETLGADARGRSLADVLTTGLHPRTRGRALHESTPGRHPGLPLEPR
ncbi:ATPase domain-containing protein [Streptomyces pratens]|uniref:Protein RecA n=1 Tax=Streptomyces pratens TaxID=887456 RepID=A0ABW1M4R6_9ACTN